MRSDEKSHIKMKAKSLPVELMLAIDHVTQCLEDWSSLVPKPSHSDLKAEWKGSMKEYLETLDDHQGTMVESISLGLIEAFDEWDGDEYQSAVEHEKTYALMQRPQTTQRTTDWYTEFKRCLTASEMYKAFGSPRERGLLVLQKAGKIELSGRGSQSAVVRSNMSPFDWGICFEPVVKQILENDWDAMIQDVGRFVHLEDTRLAASPDGLIIRSKKYPHMGGHLLEIKCPKSRPIGVKIPMEYFYQMQLQLEVTGVRACEYVEARFEFCEKENVKSEDWHGNVAVIGSFNEELADWIPSKYIYGPIRDLNWTPDLGLNERVLEVNLWKCDKFHHERVYRDEPWFNSLKPKIDEFWNDVAKAREGTFILPESSRKKKETKCLIVDDPEHEALPENAILIE
jgi:hypothetical protein